MGTGVPFEVMNAICLDSAPYSDSDLHPSPADYRLARYPGLRQESDDEDDEEDDRDEDEDDDDDDENGNDGYSE